MVQVAIKNNGVLMKVFTGTSKRRDIIQYMHNNPTSNHTVLYDVIEIDPIDLSVDSKEDTLPQEMMPYLTEKASPEVMEAFYELRRRIFAEKLNS